METNPVNTESEIVEKSDNDKFKPWCIQVATDEEKREGHPPGHKKAEECYHNTEYYSSLHVSELY